MQCSAVVFGAQERGAETQAADAEGRRHVDGSIGDASESGVHRRRGAEGGEVAVEGVVLVLVPL